MTKKSRNVLIFPAGTEIGLEIYNALKFCKGIQVFGAGEEIPSHARLIYDKYHPIRNISEVGWLNELNRLCNTLSIDYIFPAYDDVVLELSRNRSNIDATVLAPSLSTCEITRYKSKTYLKLKDFVRVPHVYRSVDDVDKYPVFIKPDRGQGSFGTKLIVNREELIYEIKRSPDKIICEYLPGEEFTVDCFSDREKGIIFSGARIRLKIKDGIAVNTRTVYLPEVEKMAKIIGDKFCLHGAWFFQLKRAYDGELVLLEVAPRISGSMAIHRMLGVNFPLLNIYESERVPIQVRTIDFDIQMSRALNNVYNHSIAFNYLYLDLDDTLILNNKVNEELIKLIFLCQNYRKKIILITRHKGDLAQTLRRFRLNGLFDDILHLNANDRKSLFITNFPSVFVDDSFSERVEVHDTLRIPTFDSSMIDLLINCLSNE